MGEFCKRHRGERDTFIEYRMRPQPITTTTKGVKEYEDGWHTQGVLRRMVNKTGINDKRARRSQKNDTIVYDGFRYDWSTIHKAFLEYSAYLGHFLYDFIAFMLALSTANSSLRYAYHSLRIL